jgi:hypothetical protein
MTKLEAQRFIENLQERVYSYFDIEHKLSEEDKRKIENKVLEEMLQKITPFTPPEKIGEMREYVKDLVSKMEAPTRFEDPVRYSIILNLKTEIEEVAKDLSIPIPTELVVGTLPSGRVNAMAIKVPSSDDFVVLFESELFTFANLLSKVVAKAMPFTGVEKGMLRFSTDLDRPLDSDVLRRFQEVLFAYLLHGRPSAAPPYIIDGPYIGLAGYLRHSMELFVLGHEYGHIIGKHFSTDQKTSFFLGGAEVNEIVYNWQQELEADALGTQLMLKAMLKRGMDLSLSFWGADFFFSCIEIVERGISIIRTGEENDRPLTSHPPPEVRRDALRKVLKNSLSEDLVDGPIKLGMTLEEIIESLWEKTRPTLRQYYENNQKLAPIW